MWEESACHLYLCYFWDVRNYSAFVWNIGRLLGVVGYSSYLKMLRVQQLFILLCLLHINQVMPEAVPCLVYSPGHAWTTLPTLVSLQPTTPNWGVQLHLRDQQNSTFACLRLESEGSHSHVDMALYTGHCGEDLLNTTKWPSQLFTAKSWTDLHISLVDNEIVFSLLTPASTTNFTTVIVSSLQIVFLYADPVPQ